MEEIFILTLCLTSNCTVKIPVIAAEPLRRSAAKQRRAPQPSPR